MSKNRLADTTVAKALVRRGWERCPSPEGAILLVFQHGCRIFGEVMDGRLSLTDARLCGRPNVHIVSYWGPWRRVADLARDLQAIEETYAELCGCSFPR